MRSTSFKLVFSLISLFSTALVPDLAHACPTIDGVVDTNCDGRLVIVCYGDSITAGRGDSAGLGYPGRLKLLLPNATVINLGVPGEDSYAGRRRAATALPRYNADYTIILQGINDFFYKNRKPVASETRNNLLEIKRIAESTGSKGVLASLLPVNRTDQGPWPVQVNNSIAPQIEIDFFSLGKRILVDSLHPGALGYSQMAHRVRDYLVSRTPAGPPGPQINSIKPLPWY